MIFQYSMSIRDDPWHMIQNNLQSTESETLLRNYISWLRCRGIYNICPTRRI